MGVCLCPPAHKHDLNPIPGESGVCRWSEEEIRLHTFNSGEMTFRFFCVLKGICAVNMWQLVYIYDWPYLCACARKRMKLLLKVIGAAVKYKISLI